MWTNLVGTAAPSLALTHTVTTSVTAAATYLFQYRAQNIYGWSDWSPPLYLIAASAPAQISPAASTHNDGTYVRIQWTLPSSDGGKPITGYTIEILDSAGTAWNQDPACNGNDATIRANLYCHIPMASLRTGTHSLAQGALVVARVSAVNMIGVGVPSAPNNPPGALVMQPPLAPASATRVDPGTTDMQITVSYPPPTDNGGSPITTIVLEWNVGVAGGPWLPLVGSTTPSLVTTFTVHGVSSGATHMFRHRADNIFGQGAYSTPVAIRAATYPDQMVPVITSVVAGSKVKIDWTPPNPRGDSVTSYKITIKTKTGTYLEDTTNCDGTNALIVAQTFCEIPLSRLQEPGFTSLSQGDLVVAQVTATNSLGTSLPSTPNTAGALIETLPGQPPTPPARGVGTGTN